MCVVLELHKAIEISCLTFLESRLSDEGGKTNTGKFIHHIFWQLANSSETVLTASKMAYLNNSGVI